MADPKMLEARLKYVEAQIDIWDYLKPTDKKPPRVLREGRKYLRVEYRRLCKILGVKPKRKPKPKRPPAPAPGTPVPAGSMGRRGAPAASKRPESVPPKRAGTPGKPTAAVKKAGPRRIAAAAPKKPPAKRKR
ncbi:MAG: hypothetical protein HY608_05410 [Planctomycetes bacterium]|nr:hypothetical protein [Planctomycetota bacterium]